MKVILLGPPGSGKGTVAERLCADYSLFHVSPGELLREEVQKLTTIGSQIKKMIDVGALVPPGLVVQMVKLVVSGHSDFLLDGFPRSVEQATLIADMDVDVVILLDVPKEEVIRRLKDRRVCTKGIHGYHLTHLPPKKVGICDVDGTPLIKRQDDDPRIISKRFKVYEQETKPVGDFYFKQKKLLRIDGVGSIDEVYARVKKSLGVVMPIVVKRK